jgi:putative transposase
MVIRAYKFRLYPNSTQAQQLEQHFGCTRFVFNWGLEQKSKAYSERHEKLSCLALMNGLPELKVQRPWLTEVNAQSLQMALRNLDVAFTNFFKKNADYPTFKSRKGRQSFQCPQSCSVDFEKAVLHIPKVKGIRAKFHRQFVGKVKTVTISRTPTGKYFVSILVEQDGEDPVLVPVTNNTLGLDVGLKQFLITSDGEKVANPKHLHRTARKLGLTQHAFARQKKGSNRRQKRKKQIARLHEKVASQRADFLHKVTHRLTRENQATTYAIEDLAVKNMTKNHCLARSISDASWGTFLGTFFQFLSYKAERIGKNVLTIGRFEPSSKRCHVCGHINQSLALKDRDWDCPDCGSHHDRDINAAKNIRAFALIKHHSTAGSAETQTLRESGLSRG